ncbi:hypothetical protein CDL12_25447 [Handroanthus impetiginosus]|uniref:Protein LNK1 n=1 Tax=Handroanthus impetiginosus TaxID=429701 RepID=A0A2G9G9R3_9LAMI|nr:hypothetical protein CDL12_25447 [Handroanthus impetiginosus]
MLQSMSELCVYEFVDLAWDGFCQSDEHIVPYTASRRLDDHFILGDSHKKPCRELISTSSFTGDRSAARYVDQRGEQGGFSTLSKRKNTMLEKDSQSQTPNCAFTSVTENDPIKETSILASDNTMPSTHGFKSNKTDSNGSEFCGHDSTLVDKTAIVDNNSFSYPLGDMNRTGSDFDIFENADNKDSSDFLYWPEIENFEDVDRMFRNCDSTFGLEVCKEDELGWLSSAEDLGGSGDVLNSDFKFPCPETNLVDNISENHDSSNGYSINDCAMTSAPLEPKDSSWNSEKSDSYLSFVSGPAIADTKDEFIPQGQGLGFNEKIKPRISTSHSRTGGSGMNDNRKKQIKLPNQSERKSREHDIGDDSFNRISDLYNGVTQLPSGVTPHQAFPSVHIQQQQPSPRPDSYNYLQNPISYVPSDNSHLSDPASINLKPSAVKYETNDLTCLSPRDSSHASSQLLYTESSHDLPFDVTAPSVCGQREKLHNCQGSKSSANSSLENGSVTLQPSIFDPGSVGKYENQSDPEGVSLVIPPELGSSNVQESSTMSSGLDDSPEAASFHQLQHVTEQMDLKTKLCIRDSLYRLARSAEQRHKHANQKVGSGDERDAGGGASSVEETNKCNSFMDMETDTNPIDRSIAHLLFHRPSDSSTMPAQDPFPFKSLNAQVRGSVVSPPALVENLAGDETISEVENVS